MTEQEQTEQVKLELYKLTEQFVKKYQWQYYKQFKGDINDLVGDFYADFLSKKGRGSVKESLLDKYNPDVTSLAYLVKQSVIRKLIDKSRGDKGEVSYDQVKGPDDEDNTTAADYFGNKAGISSQNYGNLEFDYDDSTILQAKKLFKQLPDEDKYAKIIWFNDLKDELDSVVKSFFKKVFTPNSTMALLLDKGVAAVPEFEKWKEKQGSPWRMFGCFRSSMDSSSTGFGIKVCIKDPFPSTQARSTHPNAVRVFQQKKDYAKSLIDQSQIDKLTDFMKSIGWGPVTGFKTVTVKDPDGSTHKEQERTKPIHSLSKLVFYFERYEH